MTSSMFSLHDALSVPVIMAVTAIGWACVVLPVRLVVRTTVRFSKIAYQKFRPM